MTFKKIVNCLSKIKCKGQADGTKTKNGVPGYGGVGLAQIITYTPCQNFDINLEIFKLPVTITDIARSIRMLDIWLAPTGWDLPSQQQTSLKVQANSMPQHTNKEWLNWVPSRVPF
jgi:hypothetical protein